MNNGPRPSTRAFLSDLPYLPPDSKVRFLGCVKFYNVSTGHLHLEHNYPRSKPGEWRGRNKCSGASTVPSPCFTVSVDINALIETVRFEELCVGAWVNVLGYVRHWQHQHGHQNGSGHQDRYRSRYDQQQEVQRRQLLSGQAQNGPIPAETCPVYVDAVMLFSAGPFEIGEYERIVKDTQDIERRCAN